MRRIVLLLYLFITYNVFAQGGGFDPSVPKIKNISKLLKNWVPSQRTVNQSPHGEITGWTFNRIMKSKYGPFQVADIVTMSFPMNFITDQNSKGFDLNSFDENIRFSMGISNWDSKSSHIVNGQKIYSYIYNWEKGGNKIYKLFVKIEKERFSYALATYRNGYKDKLNYETTIINNILLSSSKKEVSFIQNIPREISNFFLPTAHAQTTLGGLTGLLTTGGATVGGSTAGSTTGGNGGGLGGLLGGLNPQDLEEIQNQLGLLNENVVVLTGELDESNGHWGDSNVNWNESNGHWGDSNKNWEESNKQFADFNKLMEGFQGDFNKWAGEYNNTANRGLDLMDKHATEYNKTANRGLDIMEKMIDPKHAFVLAGATAAGAVLGGTLMKMALDIGIKGITGITVFLKKWISGELKRENIGEMLQEFKKAREQYEKIKAQSKDLQKMVDSTLTSMSILKNNFNIDKEIDVHELERLINIKKIDKKIAEENFESHYRAYKSEGCKTDLDKFNNYNSDIVGLTKDIDNLELALGKLKTYSYSKLCKELQENMDRLSQAEAALQQLRLLAMVNEEGIVGSLKYKIKDDEKMMETIRNKGHQKKISRIKMRANKTIKARTKEEITYIKDNLKMDCRDIVSTHYAKKEKREKIDLCNSLLEKGDESDFEKDKFMSYFPGMETEQIDELDNNYFFTGAKKYSYFRSNRTDKFEEIENAIQEDRDRRLQAINYMTVDPDHYTNELLEVQNFIKDLQEAQVGFTGPDWDKQRKRFVDLCVPKDAIKMASQAADALN